MKPDLVAPHFLATETINAIKPCANGLINDTWLVQTGRRAIILQRVNTSVFRHPEKIMANLEMVGQHIKKLPASSVKLIFPEILKAGAAPFRVDAEGGFWRALEFIDNSESFDRLNRISDAAQAGFILGHFHHLLSSLNPEQLHDTLPGFHITPAYLVQYDRIVERNRHKIDNSKAEYCRDQIDRFRHMANSLEDARQQGLLKTRIIHGDPKLNNFLFDKDTHKAVALIDLDTVKPGLIQYDIGDCLRSCCNTAGEDCGTAVFNLDICTPFLQNYHQETRSFLTEHDYASFYDAIQLIPFELGLRFFTDYLNGNQYFKVTRPDQNLDKALSQFQLVTSIIGQKTAIKKLIEQLVSDIT